MILESVNVPEWDGAAKEAGEVWLLTKEGHTASFSLWTHPKGGEVRLTIDGEWHRGSTALNGLTLVDLALDWKQQFEVKGCGDCVRQKGDSAFCWDARNAGNN